MWESLASCFLCVSLRHCDIVNVFGWVWNKIYIELSPWPQIPFVLKPGSYWSACSSSSISSCCSSECSSTCVVPGNGRDIHILPCTASMCAGAGCGGWCNLAGLDVLWRFGQAQVDAVWPRTCCSNPNCVCMFMWSPWSYMWKRHGEWAALPVYPVTIVMADQNPQ